MKALISILTVMLLCSGCAAIQKPPSLTVAERADLAASIADEASFQSKRYLTSDFVVQGYHRYTSQREPLVIYIEGDGHAWERYGPSDDPTPMNPLALRLAVIDQSPNVLYLARPCQYVKRSCHVKYWTSHRMAREVIDTYYAIVTKAVRTNGFSGVRLVGFSGGGGIAALLTSQLNSGADEGLSTDIVVEDLRTVAGNLDHRYWTKELALIPMYDSLNASDVARAINTIPQLHFIGRRDLIISSNVLRSYQQKSLTQRCIKASEQDASHVRGWVELWPRLHQFPVKCDR